MFCKQVTTESELQDAYTVRRNVFVLEQHVPEEEEIDSFEQDAAHFVLYDEEKHPVGAGRIRILDGIGKVERICVLSEYRGKNGGVMIMDTIEGYADAQGISKLKLNAQTHAEPFYKRIGYQTVSDVFMDAGIPHVAMTKELHS